MSGSCTPCPAGSFTADDGNRWVLNQPAGSLLGLCPHQCSAAVTAIHETLSCTSYRPPIPPPCQPPTASAPAVPTTLPAVSTCSVCDICGPGTYQDSAGSSACQECPEGTYNDLTGSTSADACLAAPLGAFAAGLANDGFTPCEGGFYQDQTGQGSCKVGWRAGGQPISCSAAPLALPRCGGRCRCVQGIAYCALPESACVCHVTG